MNCKIKLLDDIQCYNEMKHSLPLFKQFETLKSLIFHAFELDDFDTVDSLVKTELMILVTTPFSAELLTIVDKIEPLYIKKGKSNLVFLNLIRGHVFYFNNNYEPAIEYYKVVISYGMEHKAYNQVSTAINNILSARYLQIPSERGMLLSKSMPLLVRQSKRYNQEDYLSKLFVHVKYALLLDKIQYSKDILNYIEQQNIFPEASRNYLQLQFFYGQIARQTQQYEEAIRLYRYVIKCCIESELDKDLLALSYVAIVEMNNQSKDTANIEQIQQQYTHFVEAQQANDALIQKYVLKQVGIEKQKYAFGYGITKQVFDTQAEQLFQLNEQPGYTLVLMDVLLRESAKSDLPEVLAFIAQKIEQYFEDYEYNLTLYGKTTIAMSIRATEEQVQQLCYQLFAEVREIYPKEQSAVQAIYFGAVNNVSSNKLTYKACIELARAYIYYELYK